MGQSATSEMESSGVYENLAGDFKAVEFGISRMAVLFGCEQLTIWILGSKLRGGLFQGRYYNDNQPTFKLPGSPSHGLSGQWTRRRSQGMEVAVGDDMF